MNLNISAFTHAGIVRDSNQDAVLVNGQILNGGDVHLSGQRHCACFVADGVGGNRGGDFASRFVLEGVRASLDSVREDLEGELRDVNRRLLAESNGRQELRGAATTLTGLLAEEGGFKILHVGDSQIWLRRDGAFFKITNDQVLDDAEANSPLTAYFGGSDDRLEFGEDIFVRELAVEDLFLLCSDGLFKSLGYKTVRAILDGGGDLRALAHALLERCLRAGAEDNVSAILVQRTE